MNEGMCKERHEWKLDGDWNELAPPKKKTK